jgi:hypothetical protein
MCQFRTSGIVPSVFTIRAERERNRANSYRGPGAIKVVGRMLRQRRLCLRLSVSFVGSVKCDCRYPLSIAFPNYLVHLHARSIVVSHDPSVLRASPTLGHRPECARLGFFATGSGRLMCPYLTLGSPKVPGIGFSSHSPMRNLTQMQLLVRSAGAWLGLFVILRHLGLAQNLSWRASLHIWRSK